MFRERKEPVGQSIGQGASDLGVPQHWCLPDFFTWVSSSARWTGVVLQVIVRIV